MLTSAQVRKRLRKPCDALLLLALIVTHACGNGRVEPSVWGGSPNCGHSFRESTAKILTTAGALCSGIFLKGGWVLTAGHCVAGVPSFQPVTFIGGKSGTVVLNDTCLHISYRPEASLNGFSFDAALLHLNAGISGLPEGVAVADLQSPGATEKILIAWGANAGGDDGILRCSQPLSKHNKVTCQTKHPDNQLGPEEFCAGSQSSSACNGDSGGPLAEYVDSVDKLVGIVSDDVTSSACKNQWDVYTDAGVLQPWVQRVIAGDHSQCQ